MMKNRNRTLQHLIENKWLRFGFSISLAFGLALVLLLFPVTAGTVLHVPVPALPQLEPVMESLPLNPNQAAGRTINLPLPFGASLVRATNGLTITKIAPDYVDQGGILTYTLIITNDTTDPLTKATVADTLPPNTSCGSPPSHIEPLPPYPTWGFIDNCASASVGWILFYNSWVFPISFTQGTSNTLIFAVNVAQPLPDGYKIVNDTYDVNAVSATSTFSDTGRAFTTTVRAPTWGITKTVSSDTIKPGEYLTYTITVSNAGSLATQGAYTITDVLPTNTVSTSVISNPPATLNGLTLTWVFTDADLAVGESNSVTYSIQVTSPLTDGEKIVNQTYSITGGNVFSAAAGAPITTTVASTATLVITKTASPDPVQAGGFLTYTITITNDASSSKGTAFGVIISDTLPGEAVYQSAGFAGAATGIYTDTGVPTILWELSNPLAVGASAQVTVTVRVTSPLLPGFITNTFAASARNAALISDTIATEITSTNIITLNKSVVPDLVAPGGVVTYTITLTNSGNSIATINLTDVLHPDFNPPVYNQSGLSLPGRTFSTSETVTTAVFTATASITPGLYYNQAITATYDLTQATISNIAPVQVVSAVMTITKIANVSTANIGDTITYTYYITNTGNITLTNITLTDNLLGPVIPAATTLGPTASTAGTATTLVTEADLPGPITNTATVTGTYLTSNFTTAVATETVAITYTTLITVDKIATSSAGLPANIGDTITYTYRMTNTGTVTLSSITLTDDQLGPIVVSPSTLVPGQSTSVTRSIVVTESHLPGPITNTATVTGANILLETTTATDTVTVPVTYTTRITIEKLATSSAGLPANIGDTITYTYRITNTGSVSLTNVTLTDDKLGPIVVSPSTLVPGQSTSVTRSIVVTESHLPGPITNTATVTGTNLLSENDVATDTVTVPVTYTTRITIEKLATSSAGLPANIGDTITYTYRITNTGSVSLTNVTLTDDQLGSIVVSPSTLAPGQSTSVTRSIVVTESHLPGPITNTATVTGTNLLSENDVASDTVTVPVTYTTRITIEKLATSSAGLPANIGDTITYTYRMTNTGTVTLSSITLTDDQLGPIVVSPSTLAPGQSTSVTRTIVVTESHLPGPITNTATVTGTNLLSENDVASDTVTVPVTYTTGISLEKTASTATATIDEVIVYTYRLTNTGSVSLTNVTLTDDKLGLITSGLSLPPGATTVLTNYTVVQSDFTTWPQSLLTNTATVTGTDFTTAVVTDTDTVTVTLVYTPEISLLKTVNDDVVAPGQIITYTYYITNTGNVTLTNLVLTDDRLGPITPTITTLSPNGGATTGVMTYTVPGVDPVITNTAVVTGNDILNRPITDTKTLTVSVEGIITSITATNSSPTAVYSPTYFTVTTNITAGVTYTWNYGDGSPTGTGQTPVHTYTTVGTYTAVVTASNGVSTISTTTVVTITPGPVAGFVLTATTPQTAGVSFPITITAVDAYNNLVDTFNQSITISDATGTIAPTAVTLVNGITVTNFTVYSATSPALDTIEAISGTITGTVGVEIRPNDPATQTLTISPATIRVCQTAVATDTIVDNWNNPVPGETVTIAEFPPSPAVDPIPPDTGLTNGSGSFTVTFRGVQSGTASIRAWHGDLGFTPPANLTVISPAIPSAITVTVAPTSVFTGGAAIVTATVSSCVGPANGVTVTFSIPGAYGSVNPATATTNASGIATTTVTAGNTVGTTLITGTVEGPLSDDTPFTILPASAPVLTIAKTATPSSGNNVQPGNTIIYQLVISNSGSATATNMVITDALVSGVGYVSGTITSGSGPFNGGGVITFSVSSLGIGASVTATIEVTVTASVSGTVVTNTATASSDETGNIGDSNMTTHPVITVPTTPAGPIYLPIILKNLSGPPPCANLTITDMAVMPGNVISVTVANIGTCATDSGFWVDLYANPATLPGTLVGVTGDRAWNSPYVNATHGMAWAVSGLGAGSSITLTSDGVAPAPVDKVWPPSGPATLYAYVDSYDNNDPNNALYVEIPESDEYDNQFGPVGAIFPAGLESGSTAPSEPRTRPDLD